MDQALSVVRGEKDDALANLERTKSTLDDTQKKLNDWAKDLNLLSSTHQLAIETNTKLQADKDKAVQAQHDAEKARTEAESKQAMAQQELASLQTTLEGANTKIADLEKEVTSTSKSKKQVETQLASLQQYTGATLDGIKPMPPIEGLVLAVDMDVKPGLISINRGKDSNVERGFTFDIYAGKKYKGRARVEFVHATSCAAIMVYPVPGETISQGDIATTKL
jgi:multidrug efflux pump subunit AcrA (membrane-fusion protein)